MRYIGIITLLVLCLTLLLLTGCMINTVTPEIAIGNLENQEDIDQSSNNSQSSSTEPVEEPAEETGTVTPQQWATGDGTIENPWANNCIQSAYDFVPAGGTIYLKAGYYTLSDEVTITKQVNIIGEGRNKTIILTADATGFTVTANYVSIKNLTIDGDAQTDNTQVFPIYLNDCTYTSLENIEVKNSGYYGINIFRVNSSLFQKIYTHDNYYHGVYSVSDEDSTNMYNTYRDIYTWDNHRDGFRDYGSSSDGEFVAPDELRNNVYDNIQAWGNWERGIRIAYQRGGILSNSIARGNIEQGIQIDYLLDFNIHDCFVELNGQSGVVLYFSDYIVLTNVIVKNNNSSDTVGVPGIAIDGATLPTDSIKLTSCQSYDDRDEPMQEYGLAISGTTYYIELTGCKFIPNKYSVIYNYAGAVIVEKAVNAEAMLLRL